MYRIRFILFAAKKNASQEEASVKCDTNIVNQDNNAVA